LERPQAKPPSLLQQSTGDPTFQTTNSDQLPDSSYSNDFVQTLVNTSANIYLSIKDFVHPASYNYDNYLEELCSNNKEHRSETEEEPCSQSQEELCSNHTKRPSNKDNEPCLQFQEDQRGKLFKPFKPTSTHTIMNRLDFVQLHHLCTLFCPLPKSQTQLVKKINTELQSLGQILYNSDTHHPNIGSSNMFISQHNESTIPIVIDSGASKGLTPVRSDFVQFKEIKSKLTGIGSQCEIRGIGTVRWKIVDQKGKLATIETEAYYVPGTHIRLYSPQDHFKQHQSGNMNISWNETSLTLPRTKQKLSFPYDPFNKLPLMIIAPGASEPVEALIIEEDLESTDPFYNSNPASTNSSTNNNILISPNCSSDKIKLKDF
jgi:hypothetical protein